MVKTVAFNGKRDYQNLPDPEKLEKIIGDGKTLIVQVNRPTNGFQGRSSLELTKVFSEEQGVDCVVHWAKNNKTYLSIVAELSKTKKR